MTKQPLTGQGLLITEPSLSHSDTPNFVGVLWTTDQPNTETSTWQYTTLKKEKHSCHRRYWNPNLSRWAAADPTLSTARPLGSVSLFYVHTCIICVFFKI